jgi:hypothetical protein
MDNVQKVNYCINRRIVGRVVFFAVRVVSEESRQLVLPRTPCLNKDVRTARYLFFCFTNIHKCTQYKYRYIPTFKLAETNFQYKAEASCNLLCVVTFTTNEVLGSFNSIYLEDRRKP